MSDQFDPPGADPSDPAPPPDLSADLSAEALTKAEALAEEEDASYPWEADPPPDDPDAPRQRHDAFTEARKAVWLRALVKTGCILDACRLTGIAPRTVYRHQERDPSFFENCRVALRISGTPIEITAWQRAVEGVEQEYAVGGEVRVRRRYADGLLRLLLQGSNPKKFGPRPGFKRKRLLKHERKQIEREVRAELSTAFRPRSLDQVRGSILTKLAAIERHEAPKKLAAGWTKTEDGHWIPPGYGWIGLPEGSAAPGEPVSGESTPRDSM
jgi:hypothetical protein